jgi:hypothetical protein
VPQPWILRRWEAEFLEQVLPGRTHPIVLNCVQAGPNRGPLRQSFVTKALGLPEVTVRGLACELFGNILARELGVRTPTAGIIDIGVDVADALNVALTTRNLSISAGLAVGSSFMRPLTAVVSHVPQATEPEAVGLFGFDLMVQNPDRRENNPNCAMFEDQLLAFDFELCFSFLLPILGLRAEPWAVSQHGIAKTHVMYRRLHQRRPGWASILSAIAALTPEKIVTMSNLVPETWRHELAGIDVHLAALIDAAVELESELQRSIL